MDKNYLVTKSNYFIMNSSYDLSLEEQKIILTLASMVQPSDEEFKPYNFKIGDFIELLGVENQAKYTEVPKITKELMKKVFEIHEGNKIIQVAWLSSAEYEKGTGTVELEFSPKLKPYMLQLKEKFTQYQLANVLTMKSKYSPRVYEILKCNEFKKQGYLEITIYELRKLLKAENLYPKYNDFKRYVISRAQKELKKISDISFDFEEIKTSRKVTSIKFIIHSNNVNNKVQIESAIAADPEDTINDELNQLKSQIDNITGGDISINVLKKLIDKCGEQMVKEKIKTFPELINGKNIQNTVGFYIQSVIKDFKTVSKNMSSNKNQNGMIKQLDAYKFQQRNYTEEELEKLVGVDDIENEILEEKSEKQTTKI